MGEFEKAAPLLAESLACVENGERVEQAEILRLKGEVLLMGERSAMSGAEQCFREALTLARAQEARWWELRTSVSLARLLRDTGRRDEAGTLLAEIYGWFTEGFELPDLTDAKALIDELSC